MQKKTIISKDKLELCMKSLFIDNYEIFSRLDLNKKEIFMTNKNNIGDICCKHTCCAEGCCSENCNTGDCSDSCCKDGCCVDLENCCS